jgi:hypothetical protein
MCDGMCSGVVMHFEANFATATIATATAFLAKMIAARVLGATHADAGGCFVANAALKCHSPYFTFAAALLSRTRPCNELIAASLCLGICNFVVLLTLVGQIDGVLLEFFAIGDVLGTGTVEEFGQRRVLVFA